MYTGVDGIEDGVFGNEVVEESTKKLMDKQKHQIAELTPKLRDIVAMIDTEKALAIQFVSDYIDNNKDSDDIMRGELKAAKRYREYLDTLKTKFALALGESKRK
jgi:hypothetical protein